MQVAAEVKFERMQGMCSYKVVIRIRTYMLRYLCLECVGIAVRFSAATLSRRRDFPRSRAVSVRHCLHNCAKDVRRRNEWRLITKMRRAGVFRLDHVQQHVTPPIGGLGFLLTTRLQGVPFY